MNTSEPNAPCCTATTLVALGIAAVGVAGTLYLTLQMGLIACPLCLYQRVFALCSFGVLLAGLLLRSNSVGLLALPLAVGGLGVGLFQESLVQNGTIECPLGLFELGTATQQSLSFFILLVISLLVDARLSQRSQVGMWVAVLTLLGAGLAYAAISSAPPLERRTTPYPKPLNEHGCRPPYTSAAPSP